MWWLGAAGAALGAVGSYRQGQRNIKLSQATPSERDYIKQQRRIAELGDPNLQSKLNRTVGNIRQQGQFAQQRATGNIIGQGLENSIIAADIRRRTDQTTMRSIAEQSQMIAEQNRIAKQQAEDRAMQMQMGIDRRVAQARSQAPTVMDSLKSIAGAGIQGYMQNVYQPQQQFDQYVKKAGFTNQFDLMNYQQKKNIDFRDFEKRQPYEWSEDG